MTLSLDSARTAIRPFHRMPEPEVLAPLVVSAQMSAEERGAIIAIARDLLRDLRAAQSDGWVNQFLQEYRLGTEEGTCAFVAGGGIFARARPRNRRSADR